MWLIYALGGGWGHLTRAIALARVAHRSRPVRILTNSPYIGQVAGCLGGRIACSTVDSRNAALREIADCRPEVLIVDTFPRGIAGELASVDARCPRVLVHRDLNPRYVERFLLREFVSSNFQLVVIPGAGEGTQLGDPPATFTTEPWLVRSAWEIASETPVPPGSILICASGRPEELAWYGEVVAELRRLGCTAPVRCVAAERPPGCPAEWWLHYWPAMDLFGAASVVVGGAGYNTVSECLAWQVPLLARAWPRMYDRQDLRAQRAAARGRVVLVSEPEEAARAALEELGSTLSGEPHFTNGAAAAVQRIGEML